MRLFNTKMNTTMAIWFGLHDLIIIDIILITFAMLFNLPSDIALDIMIFDFCVCIILLIEWSYNFYLSKPKKIFLKQKGNWLSLLASIPFDVILPGIVPGVGLLRYLRLLKLLRIIVLFNRFFDGFEMFIKKSNLDKILCAIFITVVFFTALLYFFGPSYDIFDDFYFVIVTLTTVGYGDITPKTYNEKIISLILIFVGIFIFSTITAAISSFLIDHVLDNEDEKMQENIINSIKENNQHVLDELKSVREENQQLRDEINELKELMKK